MSSCFGASSQGTLTQLVSLGAMDKFLSQNPTITLWRFRYAKHTHFVFEPILQAIVGARFGAEVQVSLNRTGDLLHFAYLQISIPAIIGCAVLNGRAEYPSPNPCDPCGDGPEELNCYVTSCGSPEPVCDVPQICSGTNEPYCHWVNAIGQFIAERVSVVIGGQVIDTMYNDYLFMWEELAGQPGKRLTEMIGKRCTVKQLIEDSKVARTLYVPLPFWFTYNTGNALALVSLQFHTVQIIVQLANLQRCIQTSPSVPTQEGPLVVQVKNCRTGQPVTDTDIIVNFEGLYVYLDRAERDRFAASSFEQLMNAVQRFSMPMQAREQANLAINFNHPVIELIWAVRRSCQADNNNYFNYSGKYGRDPITQVQLILNGNDRFSRREGRYFRLVVPFQWHTLIPDNFIYCFSFATEPEKMQPTGSCNFSRIDNAEFVFAMQEELATESVNTLVFARNWQVFKYRQGLGGIAFANKNNLRAKYTGPAVVLPALE
jgi:hypothetical protein